MDKKGIDVSKWQGTIQWNQVKQDGVDFAIIRAATGLNPDPSCKANMQNALAAEIPIGLYLYSYALDPDQAVREAEFLLQMAAGHSILYPLAIDVEDSSQQQLSNQLRTDIVLAFAKRIRDAGFVPMLYASKYWLENLFDLSRLSSVDIWVAQWGSQNTFQGDWAIWQFSNTGKISGISGNVDLNCCRKDYSAQKLSSGWRLEGSRWYYNDCKNCWRKIDGKWYWFEPDGMAAEGLHLINNKWYAFADHSIGPIKQCQCLITDNNGAILE
ncbi:MAG: GH25 family lysozyme [Candidatus Merdivicinus sp.]|jgi:lysozyme